MLIIGTTIVFATDPALALLGTARAKQVVGRDVFEFVAPASVDAVRARHESAARGEWPRPGVVTIRRVDGSEMSVEIASGPVIWKGTPASQVTLWAIDTADHHSS